jgi:hypothetical protein
MDMVRDIFFTSGVSDGTRRDNCRRWAGYLVVAVSLLLLSQADLRAQTAPTSVSILGSSPQAANTNVGSIGSTFTFTVFADGTPPLTYAWQKDGVVIAGVTGSVYTINPVTAGSAGNYVVTATNAQGSVSSAAFNVVLRVPAPTITQQPVAQALVVGSTLTLSVAVSGGTAPFTYRWYKNSTFLTEIQTSSYTKANAQVSDGGSYFVQIESFLAPSDSVQSDTVSVTINSAAPVITQQPLPQTSALYGSATFSVVATGSSLTYQWSKNSVALSGATGSTLFIPVVDATSAGSYSVRVLSGGALGPSVTSNSVPLTITSSVIISSQPVAQSAIVSGTVTFAVTASTANNFVGPITYQWEKNGANISGATGAILTLNNVQAGDAGSYSVLVSDLVDSLLSATASLSVNAGPVAPVITAQPQAQSVIAGNSATFSVAATGAPLTYQWRKDGTNISGANGATLTLNNVQAGDAGSYSVLVSNSAGSVASTSASLSVTASAVAPAITAQPQAQSVIAGNSATFSVTATGTSLTYQWRKDGTNISGGTDATLTLNNVQAGDAGSYSVLVSNTAGSVASTSASLSVTASAVAPAITAQPQGQAVVAGNSVTFSVVATGNALTYQWRKGGINLSGATGATLTLNDVEAGDVGSYSVVISGSGGSVTSADAALSLAVAGTSRISNLSVRTNLGNGQTLIVGFVTSGAQNILIRAVGPSLNPVFGVSNFYADPKFTVFSQGTVIDQNDSWDANLAATFARLGAFPLSSGSADAALLRSISGPNTAQVNGTGSGILLVEVYDADPTGASRLMNVSARNQVGTGADILISGFVIAGTAPEKLLIRGIGPALHDVFGISGVLADPILEIHQTINGQDTVIASNDNWDPSLTATFDAVGAFHFTPSSKDAALLVTLQPGVYTVQVSGANGGTGDGVVEVYEVP